MPLIGVAYNSWFFWDGRTDSLWSQALGPIESKLEHGISRTMSAYIISINYREEYEELFGPLSQFMEETFPHNARPALDDPEALKAWVLMTPEQRDEMVKRAKEKGSMVPEGIKVINEWCDATGGKSFSLFEANNSNDILAWVYAWSDIIKFEVTPVMEVEKVMEAI